MGEILGYSDDLVTTLFEELVNMPTLVTMEGIDDCCSVLDFGGLVGIEVLILFLMGIDTIVGVPVAIKELVVVKKLGEDVEGGEREEMGREGEMVFWPWKAIWLDDCALGDAVVGMVVVLVAIDMG